MTTIIEEKVRKSANELQKIIAQAKRKLFEFETLANAREIQRGNFLEFKTPRDFFRSIAKNK